MVVEFVHHLGKPLNILALDKLNLSSTLLDECAVQMQRVDPGHPYLEQDIRAYVRTKLSRLKADCQNCQSGGARQATDIEEFSKKSSKFSAKFVSVLQRVQLENCALEDVGEDQEEFTNRESILEGSDLETDAHETNPVRYPISSRALSIASNRERVQMTRVSNNPSVAQAASSRIPANLPRDVESGASSSCFGISIRGHSRSSVQVTSNQIHVSSSTTNTRTEAQCVQPGGGALSASTTRRSSLHHSRRDVVPLHGHENPIISNPTRLSIIQSSEDVALMVRNRLPRTKSAGSESLVPPVPKDDLTAEHIEFRILELEKDCQEIRKQKEEQIAELKKRIQEEAGPNTAVALPTEEPKSL
eukprot:ANDGO_04602.mRNA.1 hypothetical protein